LKSFIYLNSIDSFVLECFYICLNKYVIIFDLVYYIFLDLDTLFQKGLVEIYSFAHFVNVLNSI